LSTPDLPVNMSLRCNDESFNVILPSPWIYLFIYFFFLGGGVVVFVSSQMVPLLYCIEPMPLKYEKKKKKSMLLSASMATIDLFCATVLLLGPYSCKGAAKLLFSLSVCIFLFELVGNST
jgi:hypothetical protein